jgi:epoxyqueuosine reductase QueG
MNTKILHRELLIRFEFYKFDFLHFVNISHLTKEQNKGFETAILFGKALSKNYLRKIASRPDYVEQLKLNKTITDDEFYLTEISVDKIADEIEQFIISKGFKAYSQSEKNIINTGFYDKENRQTPLPHKTIAGLAGIGWIGKNNLLVTKKFGSAISMCSVLTNVPLSSTLRNPIPPKCGNCQICMEICKTNALKGKAWESDIQREKILDVFKCSTCFQCVVQCPWTKKYFN